MMNGLHTGSRAFAGLFVCRPFEIGVKEGRGSAEEPLLQVRGQVAGKFFDQCIHRGTRSGR